MEFLGASQAQGTSDGVRAGSDNLMGFPGLQFEGLWGSCVSTSAVVAISLRFISSHPASVCRAFQGEKRQFRFPVIPRDENEKPLFGESQSDRYSRKPEEFGIQPSFIGKQQTLRDRQN